MARTKKGKAIASSSAQEPGERVGIPADYDFTEWDEADSYTHPTVTISAEAKVMPPEANEWLRFPGASRDERNDFLNKLAVLKFRSVKPARGLDWRVMETLGLKDEMERMLTTKIEVGGVRTFEMWRGVFSVDAPAVREWCLEFYATLRLERDLKYTQMRNRKVIHFRAGGVQRHCTGHEFAYLLGIFPREDFEDEDLYSFFRHGIWDEKICGFPDGKSNKAYWMEISGEDELNFAKSKIANCSIPILRVIHKVITYLFLQRTNQNDKVSVLDVWLMRLFHEGEPYTYACAPYVLARFMQQHVDKRLVGGHYVAMIYRRLGLDGDRTCRYLIRVPRIWLTMMDLKKSGLVVLDVEERDTFITDIDFGDEGPPTRRRRRDDDVPDPEAAGPSQPPPYDMSSVRGSLEQIWDGLTGLRNDCHQFFDQTRLLSSQVQRLAYNQEYAQPYVNRWIERERQAPPEGMQYRPYAPPPIFMPRSSTYGFYYPEQGAGSSQPHYMGSVEGTTPMFGSYSGGASASTGGDVYAGHAFDYYGSGFFSEPVARDGDGTPSVFTGDDMEQ